MKNLSFVAPMRLSIAIILAAATTAFLSVETRADDMVVHQQTYSMPAQSEFLGYFYSEHYDDRIADAGPPVVYGYSNLWVFLEITVRDKYGNVIAEGGLVIQQSGGEIDIMEIEDDGLWFDSLPTETGQNLSELTAGISYQPPVGIDSPYQIEVKLWKSWDFYEPDMDQNDTQEVGWVSP